MSIYLTMCGGLVACYQEYNNLANNFFLAHLLASFGVLGLDHHIQHIILIGQGLGVVSSIAQTFQCQATNPFFSSVKAYVREEIESVTDGIH